MMSIGLASLRIDCWICFCVCFFWRVTRILSTLSGGFAGWHRVWRWKTLSLRHTKLQEHLNPQYTNICEQQNRKTEWTKKNTFRKNQPFFLFVCFFLGVVTGYHSFGFLGCVFFTTTEFQDLRLVLLLQRRSLRSTFGWMEFLGRWNTKKHGIRWYKIEWQE